jgi:hypothetical protein
VEGQGIDIGWDRPVRMQQIAQISGRLLGQQIRLRTIPAGVINGAAAVAGRFIPMVRDMAAMTHRRHPVDVDSVDTPVPSRLVGDKGRLFSTFRC